MQNRLQTHFPLRLPALCLIALALLACRPLAFASDDEEAGSLGRDTLVELIAQTLASRPRSRSSVLVGIDPRRASAGELEILRALRRPVSLTVKNQPVADVLALFRKVSGVNFTMSRRARESLVSGAPKYALSVKRLSLENVLGLFAIQLGDYRFRVRYGTVQMVHRDEYRPRVQTRFYSVSDLVRPKRDFRAPRMTLMPSSDED